MSNFIKLLRNSDIYASREAAVSALQTKLAALTDGEICIASYGTSWDTAKSILGVARYKDNKHSYTIFDVDQTSSDVQKAIEALDVSDVAVEGQYVSSVSETDGKISVTRKDLEASTVKYTNEMSVAATLKKLMDKNFPLTVSCTITPNSLQEIGTTVATVTISGFSATVDGKSVTVTGKTVNGTAVSGASWTASNVSKTTTYTVNITAEGETKSVSKSLTFVGPIYVGYSSASAASEADMKTLTKQSLRSSFGTVTFNGTATESGGQYVTIYTPYAISHVLSAGFDIFGEFAKTTFTYQGVIYYCYRHTAKTASAAFTIS